MTCNCDLWNMTCKKYLPHFDAQRVVPIVSVAALFENGELRLKLSFLIIISHKKITNWTSNRIVIVKRKYIFEVQTPPHQPSDLSTDAIVDGSSQFCLVQQRYGAVFRFRVIY